MYDIDLSLFSPVSFFVYFLLYLSPGCIVISGRCIDVLFLAFVLPRFSACAILHRVLPILYIMQLLQVQRGSEADAHTSDNHMLTRVGRRPIMIVGA